MFSQMFVPVAFWSPVSPLLVFLIVYSFQGITRKKWRDAMAAYLI